MKWTTWMLALAIAGLMLIAAACGGAKNNNAPESPAPPAESNAPAGNQGTTDATAESVYKQQCVGCHAADLSGGVGPNLQKVGGQMSADQISTQIQNGGGGMPPFKNTLTADEITALTNWLAAHK